MFKRKMGAVDAVFMLNGGDAFITVQAAAFKMFIRLSFLH
jgi:hypothetical protein